MRQFKRKSTRPLLHDAMRWSLSVLIAGGISVTAASLAQQSEPQPVDAGLAKPLQDDGSKPDSKSTDSPPVDLVTPPSDAAPRGAAAEVTADDAVNRLVRLDPQAEVWVDAKQKRVIVGGEICLRKGLLEMFACPEGTKEHESIVAVNAKAYLVHTALLSIGARTGNPVQYDPVYKAATGSTIQVEVIWRDEQGQVVRRPAQEMIQHVKTLEPMKHHWVFAGSGFWQEEEGGDRYYMAEGGELICVSNFSTATMDLPVESPRDNADLLYQAYTDRIPELGTKVRLILSVKNKVEP